MAWWTARIGSYALADVTPALLAEQREVLSREITHYGKERSAGTVNRYLISLSHVFTLASREWGCPPGQVPLLVLPLALGLSGEDLCGVPVHHLREGMPLRLSGLEVASLLDRGFRLVGPVLRTGLENRRRFTPTVGSNPTPSARPVR